MQLYLEEENYVAGLKYLFRAAKAGYKKAYGEIGIILYREKNEADKDEEWFKKAEEAGCPHAPHAYDYGMLLIEERGDIEMGNRYLDKAAEDGYKKSQNIVCPTGCICLGGRKSIAAVFEKTIEQEIWLDGNG
jgi:tetratricopeptide (TPR) repeat protein